MDRASGFYPLGWGFDSLREYLDWNKYMFEPEWMEYFEREAPFSYYCILFLQFLIMVLSYFSYVVLLFVIAVPIFMIYSGTKAIKIKLIEDKKHKKLRKEHEKQKNNDQQIYLDRLSKNLNKKRKHQ